MNQWRISNGRDVCAVCGADRIYWRQEMREEHHCDPEMVSYHQDEVRMEAQDQQQAWQDSMKEAR